MLSGVWSPEAPLPGVGWTLNMVVCRTGGAHGVLRGRDKVSGLRGDLSLLAQKLGSQVFEFGWKGVSPR